MRGKATKSGEQVVIFNLMFTDILKYTTLQKVKISYWSVYQKLQDLLYQQLEGLSNKVIGIKRQVEKAKNIKEEFSKLDEFDLNVIRRKVHGYYAWNENFSLEKLLNKLSALSILNNYIELGLENALF